MITRHIALICDDNYCFPTIVCIQSIISYASDDIQYVIHVCTFGLTHENVEKLECLGGGNVVIVINQFNKSAYEDRLKRISQKTHVTPAALIKFELPLYFTELDSILYLDSDIILKGNIDGLLSIDLDNYYLAAVYDFHTRINKINYSFNRDYNDFYFNSGVMLLNLKMMRQDDVTSKFWFYKENCTKTKLMDQETLNAVCESKVIPLSLIWNFNPFFYKERYLNEINNVYHTDFKDIKTLEKEVRIIHYVGKSDKPWLYEDASLRSYWDAALKEYDPGFQLVLEKYSPNSQSKVDSLKSKIKLFGIKGVVCFVINRLLNRTIL